MRLITILAGGVASAALTASVASAQAPSAQAVVAQNSAAQTAGASAGDTPAANGNEVVVTARKRAERLKDVPIAVTDITASTFAQQQIYQVKDIAAFAPGLNINSDSVGRSFVSIRGVGATLIDTVQPGVGIFIDGIYEPDTSYLNTPLLDVARIEVLRGPQGTLFGNNTLGGAISIVTQQPTDTFHGSLSGAYAGPDNFQSGAATISGPIIPGVLQARLGVSYHDQEGFEKNTLIGGEANPLDQNSASGELRWEPTTWAIITLNGAYDRVHGGTTPYADLTGPKDYSEDVTLNANSIASYTYGRLNLKGEFDVPAIKSKVTTVLAYDSRDGKATGDGDFGPVDYIRVNNSYNHLKTLSGELRFDTTYDEHFSSLVGVYADKSITDTHVFDYIVPIGVTVPSEEHDDLEAQAVFGTLFWKIDPTLEFAAGLRYDHQLVSVNTDPKRYKAHELEPRFTLTKHWTSDFMTYGSISRGFRGGGANGPGAPNPIYQGDSVWTYETGAKVELLDRKLSFDTALFYNDYSNFIGQNSLAPSTNGSGAFVAINLNTGKVQSYGAELEASYRPTERLNFSTGLTLLHARITDGSEYVQTTGMALPSDRILFTPDWNFYVNGSYTQPRTPCASTAR
jgi:iron complex outermembrane receptor protein